MKRTDLIRRIRKAARAADRGWAERMPSGSKHGVWVCGTTTVTIPRHREINEDTAEGIMKELETELGENWWR